MSGLSDSSEIKDAKEALIDLGWSEYESKTFSALILQGTSTASQIAKISQVPPNRVYQILDKLSEKGYVGRKGVTRGGPSYFFPNNPQKILEDLKNEYIQKIENAKQSIQELSERTQDQNELVTYTIDGGRELRAHLFDIISSAKEELLIEVDTLVEYKYRGIKELLLERCNEEKLDIKMLTSERGINDDYEMKIVDDFKDVGIKVTNDPFPTILLIADNNQVIITNYGFESGKEDRNYLGVYYQDEGIANMFKRLYLNSWETGELANEKIIEHQKLAD